MQMITGAILIVGAVVAAGFCSLARGQSAGVVALLGLLCFVLGVFYLISGTPDEMKKKIGLGSKADPKG